MTFGDKKKENLYFESILENTINGIKICKALRNKEAVTFTKNLIKSHYKNIMPQDKVLSSYVDKTFKRLTEGQINNASIVNLKKSINMISENIYTKNKIPNFFKVYDLYKSLLKPEYYFSIIKKDILGRKILDFGTGKGYMSKYLHNNGFKTVSTDILDYRELDNQNIPFIKIMDTDDISKKIPQTDTSILITVLHHISKKHIGNTLKELSKITKRLIIIEDIFDSSYIGKNMNNDLSKNENTNRFLKLSKKSRGDSIKIIDFYGNIVTQGLIKMNLPFQFNNVDAWEEILKESGFSIESIEFIGLPKISFHGFFQVKIVCNSNNI